MNLDGKVQALKLARERHARLNGELRNRRLKMETAFEEDNAQLINEVHESSIGLELCENELRSAAIEMYDADPSSKKVHPKVSIAIVEVVEYEEDEALEWAKSKGLALKLDATAYKKLVKAGAGAPATVKQKTTAKISTIL